MNAVEHLAANSVEEKTGSWNVVLKSELVFKTAAFDQMKSVIAGLKLV